MADRGAVPGVYRPDQVQTPSPDAGQVEVRAVVADAFLRGYQTGYTDGVTRSVSWFQPDSRLWDFMQALPARTAALLSGTARPAVPAPPQFRVEDVLLPLPSTPPRRPHARWTGGFIHRLARLVCREIRAPYDRVWTALNETVHELVYGNRGPSSRVLASADGVIGRPGWDAQGIESDTAEEWLRRAIATHYESGTLEEGQPVRLTLSVEPWPSSTGGESRDLASALAAEHTAKARP